MSQTARASDAFFRNASCQHVDDKSIFFPSRGEDVEVAKRVCHNCPVETECLAWALEHREAFGIWGGLSERQRRRLRKGQAPRLKRCERCYCLWQPEDARSHYCRDCVAVARLETARDSYARRQLAG